MIFRSIFIINLTTVNFMVHRFSIIMLSLTTIQCLYCLQIITVYSENHHLCSAINSRIESRCRYVSYRTAQAGFFRTGPGPHSCYLGPSRKRNEISAWARPKTKYKILAQAGSANFFSCFRRDRLILSDFKTDLFSCLHILNIFFVADLFFCNLLKEPI